METEEVFRTISETKFRDEFLHLQDLWKTPAKTHQNILVGDDYKIAPNVSHIDNLYHIIQIALYALLTLFTDFTLALKHPLYWLYMIFVYPIILVAYFILEISLFFLNTLKLDGIKHTIDDKWSEYTSRDDELFDIEFFSERVNKEIVDEGVDALNKPYYKDFEDDDSVDRTHNCNLDIAQLLLFMSDLVYNRDASKVLKAKQKLNMIKFQPEKSEQILQEVVALLNESEEPINAKNKKWKLKYTTVSELNSLGESFAGIFYSERHNFIVVTFKGTTIDNFEKWMTEMLFQRIDGQTFFSGKSYNGYRSILYPNDLQPSPYATIIEGIRNAVQQIRSYREKNSSREKKRNINVWVTGHSFGGAMATMFYARCINSPNDLGEHCVLRDAYTFGSPSVENSEFAKTYMSALDKGDEVSNTLWRIVNDDDIMCKLPIGFYHSGSIGKYNSLDNIHIGEAIRFYQNGSKPTLIKNPLITNGDKNHYPIIKSSRPNEDGEIKIPVGELDKKLPTFIRNNTISRYAIAMAIARNHLHEKNVGNSGRTKSGYQGLKQ
ncbi:10006_t:CDS:2 [Diversispora eburnea]|uniref:10006_t:CDS:1 n=1 Tax=Diversispora eburnea TaxID=1213867 RepID=A0A9N9B9B2_9GLOM|nr:10006_t:CDS:2 [Diversispora eburnea]